MGNRASKCTFEEKTSNFEQKYQPHVFSCITIGSTCEINIRNEKNLKHKIKKLKIHVRRKGIDKKIFQCSFGLLSITSEKYWCEYQK